MTEVALTAANLDLTFMQGSLLDGSVLSIVWKRGVPPIAVDLTGWSARAQFRAKINATETVFDLSTEDDSIQLGADGSIELIIDEEVSSAATKYSGVYDLELTDPTGSVIRLLQGAWTMLREVTRDV
jgi:hypothetical protein